MKRNAFCVIVILFSLSFSRAYAMDFVDGRIRLVIHENTGRFALYYKSNPNTEVYDPLFWDRDQFRTSFFSIIVNNKSYVLGDSRQFRVHLRGTKDRPLLAFESPEIAVSAEFSFIRTATSNITNAVRIDIKVENWGEQRVSVGVRALIDTFLGEKETPHFFTDVRGIQNETITDRITHEQWWVSRSKNYGAMGSLFISGIELPDSVYFANWKRLHDAKFMPVYQQGRSFTQLPFSVNDSAVSYYLEAMPLSQWEQRSMTILLGAEDRYGFENPKIEPLYEEPPLQPVLTVPVETPMVVQSPNGNVTQSVVQPPNGSVTQSQSQAAPAPSQVITQVPTPPPPARKSVLLPIGSMRIDLVTLRSLVSKIDNYIYYNVPVTDDEITSMENLMTTLRSRYGGIFTVPLGLQ